MDIGTSPREPWKPTPVEPEFTGIYPEGYTKSVAVLIGINEYDHWPDLKGAVVDVKRMEASLKELGFAKIIKLYDDAASREEILEVLT